MMSNTNVSDLVTVDTRDNSYPPEQMTNIINVSDLATVDTRDKSTPLDQQTNLVVIVGPIRVDTLFDPEFALHPVSHQAESSSVFIDTLSDPPSIAQQPQSQIVGVGGQVSLSVVSDGTPPFACQWWKDGSLVANGGRVQGATNVQLTITNAQLADSGTYRVVVFNYVGIATSQVAQVTVYALPELTQQPASQTLTRGASAAFNATVASQIPLSYQWFKDGAALTNGGRTSGCASSNLLVSGLQWGDAGQYFVIASNMVGATTSSAALLIISNQAPVWTSQPFTNAPVGQLYSHALLAADGDTDTLVFSAGTLPSWLSLECIGATQAKSLARISSSVADGASQTSPVIAAINGGDWTALPVFDDTRLGSTRYYEGEGWLAPTVKSQEAFAPAKQSSRAQAQAQAASSRLVVSPLANQFPGVGLYVTVMDANGQAVTNLAKNAFSVWEQSENESVATAEVVSAFEETSGGQAGISFSMVFDVSGSMDGQSLTDSKTAAINFLQNTSDADRGNVVEFASYNQVQVVIASDWVSTDSDHDGTRDIVEAVNSLYSMDSTALFDGAAKGIESLSQEPTPKAVIVFTDGGENDSTLYTINTLIAKAKNEGVPLYTIGLGSGADTNILMTMASQTGGSFYYAPTALDMAGVYNAIAKEVRSQYYLRYTTHNTNYDGTLRTVTVSAAGQTGTGAYRVDYIPQPQLDAATLTLNSESQPPHVALTISGLVADLDALSTGQSLAATLYYRGAGTGSYAQTPVVLVSLGGGQYTWSAAIPSDSVVYPGLNYYLHFSDNFQEVYLPFNYATMPYSISVLTNHAPTITHTAPTLGLAGQALAVSAEIVDVDQGDGVSQATVFYRVHDEQQTTPYYSIAMTRGNGNTFTAAIPAGKVTDVGVDYYLSAWDNYSVRADSGSAATPYFVPSAGYRLVGTPTLEDVGQYPISLTVSDGYTNVPQTFTIIVPPKAPEITSLPQSQTVTQGGAAVFGITVIGSAPLSYQWQMEGTNVAGATSETLTLTNAQVGQQGGYSVIISNVAGAVTSAPPAMLTVVIPPDFISSPASQTVWEGSNAVFSVVVSGTSPFAFQWLFNGQALTGETGSTLVLSNVTETQSGNYSVVATNFAGAKASQVAVLNVHSWGDVLNTPGLGWNTGGAAPWYFQTNVTHDGAESAQSGTISDNTNSFIETTVTGPGELSFWWKVSSESGSDFLNFRVNGTIQASISGDVDWVRQTNFLPRGTVTLRWEYAKDFSSAEGLDAGWLDQVEYVPVIAPAFVSQPQSLTVLPGTNLHFSASITGSSPMSLRWYFNGTALADGSSINGAATTNLTLSNVQPAQAGDYFLVASNAANSVTSQVATLVVIVPPVISTPPASQNAAVGATVRFSFIASSVVAPTYQWLFNNAIMTGQTNADLVLSNAQFTQNGGYSVVVSNVAGSVTSSPVATLKVWAPPVILSDPQSLLSVGGSTAVFQTDVSGTGPMNYQWRFNGTNMIDSSRISGVTTSNLTIIGVSRDNAGTYVAMASNYAGIATSAPALLQVEPLRFGSINRNSNGLPHLQIQGEWGKTVKIQGSTNLQSWVTLSNVVNQTGLIDYTDQGASNMPFRFYRALMP